VDHLILAHLQHHGVQLYLHVGFAEHLHKPPGVFGAGELLLEVVEAKAVVNALVEDATQLLVPLDNDNFLGALFGGGAGGGKAGGASADDDNIVFHITCPPL
jgi:hypothetical protein